MDWLKIDQVSKESGLTKRTIRYYEQIGILPPPMRSEGGIRCYTQEHIDLLIKIKNAKEALGFSLQELQYFISLGNAIEANKVDYKRSFEPAKQKEKLIEIINNIDQKLILIEKKIDKIQDVRRELLDLKKRAEAVVEKMNMENFEE